MIKHAILSDRIKLRKLLVFPIYLRIACFINLLKDCVDFWKLVLEGKTSHMIWHMRLKASNHRFQFRENFVFDFAEIFFDFFFSNSLFWPFWSISLHTKIREKSIKKLWKRKLRSWVCETHFWELKKSLKKSLIFFGFREIFFRRNLTYKA